MEKLDLAYLTVDAEKIKELQTARAALGRERLGQNALDQSLAELQPSQRSSTLGAVANGTLTADAAIVRVETVRSLEALAHHAWRSAAHLVGAEN